MSSCGPLPLWIRTTEVSSPYDVGVRGRTTQRLGPVRRKPCGVVRVIPVAEGVAHHLVGHDPGVPRAGQTKEPVEPAGGLVHRCHVATIAQNAHRAATGLGCGHGAITACARMARARRGTTTAGRPCQ